MATSKIERSYHKAGTIRRYVHNYTIDANGAIAISAADLGITAIDGYGIRAIVGYDLGNNNNLVCRNMIPKLSGTVAIIRNISASAVTVEFCIYVLWIRSDMG